LNLGVASESLATPTVQAIVRSIAIRRLAWAANRRSLATPQINNRRSGRRRSCRRDHLVADNGLANGGKRNAGELQMLNPEWNSDDGDKAPEGPEHMPDRQPDSGEDEPYDVAKRAERTGTDVVCLLVWSAIIRAAGTSVSDTCKRSPTLA
jgi:hypothetical protein